MIVEQDPAVCFIGDQPNWSIMAVRCFGQTVGEALQGGGRIDSPTGVVWRVHENRSGPGPYDRGDGVDVQIEGWGPEPNTNRRGAAGQDHRLVEIPWWAQEDDLIAWIDHGVES